MVGESVEFLDQVGEAGALADGFVEFGEGSNESVILVLHCAGNEAVVDGGEGAGLGVCEGFFHASGCDVEASSYFYFC
jgi:hypothetical protein